MAETERRTQGATDIDRADTQATRGAELPNRNGFAIGGEKVIYTITAYCGCVKCCGKTDKITASGVMATEGITIAADTNILPFGTKVIIDGNVYTVQDRGGAIKGNRIDVYFESHQKALEHGIKKNKEIIILK